MTETFKRFGIHRSIFILLLIIICLFFSMDFLEAFNTPKFLFWAPILVLAFLLSPLKSRLSIHPFFVIFLILNGLEYLRFNAIPFYVNHQIALTNIGIFTAIFVYNYKIKTNTLIFFLQLLGILMISWGLYGYFNDPINADALLINSTTGNPAYTGATFVPIVLLLFGVLSSSYKFFRTKLHFIRVSKIRDLLMILGTSLVVIETIYIVLTKSRSSVLGLVAGFVFISLVLKTRRLAIISLIFFISIILFIPKFRSAATNYFDLFTNLHKYEKGDTLMPSNLSRFIIQFNSMEMVKQFPLAGIGSGQFLPTYPLYSNSKIQDIEFDDFNHVAHPHSEPVLTIVERGIPFFILWIAFHFFIFLNPQVPIWYRAAIFGMFVQSFFEFNFSNPASALIYWILIGRALSFIKFKERSWVEKFRLNFLLPAPFALLVAGTCFTITYESISSHLGKGVLATGHPEYFEMSLSFNSFDVQNYINTANVYLARQDIKKAFELLSVTKDIVPTLPHPYQNAARILAKTNTQNLYQIVNLYYSMSMMMFPASISAPVERAKLFSYSEKDYKAMIDLTYFSKNFFLRDRTVTAVERCEPIWRNAKDQTRCPSG